MSMNLEKLKQIIEGALLAAGRPLSIDIILSLFLDEEQPSRDEIRQAVQALQAECESRGVELKEVSTGFRYQVKADLAEWVGRLWEEKPARYSRAVLETLALIAYRQPITRSEIEDVRGVSVSSHIIKSLLEREWIRIIGHRDVPGKPALFGTTKTFLDYFNLKNLSDLPPLAELRNIDSIERELDFGDKEESAEGVIQAANDAALEQGDVQPVAMANEFDVVAEAEAENPEQSVLEAAGVAEVEEITEDLADAEEAMVEELDELLDDSAEELEDAKTEVSV